MLIKSQLNHILFMIMARAGLSILGALGKLSSSGPPRAIHAKAIVHYSTIHKQHINTRLCMHANTVLTLFVKCIVSYFYLSILLFMCYHITMKVCLEL